MIDYDDPEYKAHVDSRQWKGLPLTIDEAIGRYLRQIAWGQECADYLRDIGFEKWRDMFRGSHQRYREQGGRNEWDSWDYTDDEMRQIYDGVIEHAIAGTKPDEVDDEPWSEDEIAVIQRAMEGNRWLVEGDGEGGAEP